MSNTAGKRYAKALFELAKGGKFFGAVESQIEELGEMIANDSEFASFLSSPVVSRNEKLAVVNAIATKAGFRPSVKNMLCIMAEKGRLELLPSVVHEFRELLKAQNDELVAEVISATKLTAAQNKKLADTLKEKTGKTVTIQSTIDESLIGGLVVKMGSTMIDSSVKGRLSKLHNAMKEVG